ncbi:MAG: hypothetical protein HY705_02275 [Gemmatimonadetes bacterium]|nr:hypothetical protein [Gemmatimonadota bacterium]
MRLLERCSKGWWCALLGGAAVLAAGCGGDDGGTEPVPVSAEVSLGAAEHVLLAGAAVAGAVRFPAAGADGAQYLVVGQFATATSGVRAKVTLSGSASSRAPAAPVAVRLSRPLGARERFHGALRRMDAEAARLARSLVAAAPAPPEAAPPPAPAPPVLGSQRTFKVCDNLDCSSLTDVVATARYVGTRAAIYLDDTVPSQGFTPTDLAQLGSQFEEDLYPIAVAAFGAESDVDGNGVVIILLSDAINDLVGRPECNESFVTGFFLGADIAPGTKTQYNNGEVFYGLVPDPLGQVSCPRTVPLVKALLPSTFIHEFQHMISFNQHVLLRNGETERPWLNEALSHLAEELGGLHYDSVGNQLAKSQFLLGNLLNAFLYLSNPSVTAVVTESANVELEQRGAQWLFLRYVVDRFDNDVTRQLVQTSSVGEANLVAVTGTPFKTLLGRWALAVYVTDLPAFAPQEVLRYAFWSFRTTYAALNQQDPDDFDRPYPLLPALASGGAFAVTDSLKSGSGAYLLITQPTRGEGFDLLFRRSSGDALPTSGVAQLAIVRIR